MWGPGKPGGGEGGRGDPPRAGVPCSHSRSASHIPHRCWRTGPRSRPHSRAAPPEVRTSCQRASLRSGGSQSAPSSWPRCLSPAREDSRTGFSEHAHGTTVALHHGHLEHRLHRGWLVSWVSNRHSPLTRLVIFSFEKNYLGAVLCLMHSASLEVLVLGDRVRKSDLDVGHKTRVGARALVPQEECLPQTGWNGTSRLPHLLPPE